jgi:hypothetical protein
MHYLKRKVYNTTGCGEGRRERGLKLTFCVEECNASGTNKHGKKKIYN